MELKEITTLDDNQNIVPLFRTASEIGPEEKEYIESRKKLEKQILKDVKTEEDKKHKEMFVKTLMIGHNNNLPSHVTDPRKMPSEEPDENLRYLRETEFRLHYYTETESVFSDGYYLEDKFTKRKLKTTELEKIICVVEDIYSPDNNIVIIYNKNNSFLAPDYYEFINIIGALPEAYEKEVILKISEKQVPKTSKKTIDDFVKSEQNQKIIKFYKIEHMNNPSRHYPQISYRV